ncbi:chymotrypsin [Danaus plexippus plexippus]|uniref:Chymotrypsin n=1 Tax=Danaus plexippus plexippus TaxID=278856 RepID=A0A212ERX9_DANPL|nr:chymotrypsin [Danaus plexippus plexippus]
MAVITNEICNVAVFGDIQSSNICTNTLGDKSTCRGDSGGPLVVQRRVRTVLTPKVQRAKLIIRLSEYLRGHAYEDGEDRVLNGCLIDTPLYTIGTVSLPTGLEIFDDFNGQVAIASGYGLTQDGGSISNSQFLSYVNMSVITNEVCNIAFFGNIRPSNICTSTQGGKSTCRGDSGGPLVVQRRDRTVLVGVTSFGIAFGCEIGWPAAFSRITSFLGFINDNL